MSDNKNNSDDVFKTQKNIDSLFDGMLLALAKEKKDIFDKNNILEYNFIKFKITQKEKEVIRLLIEGKSSKELSRILNISKNTVSNHIRNIYKKAGVNNRVMLVNTLIKY